VEVSKRLAEWSRSGIGASRAREMFTIKVEERSADEEKKEAAKSTPDKEKSAGV